MTQNAPDGEPQKDKVRGHVFDGIFEYDNDLPRWWVMMFLASMVFAAGYMLWYHSGLFPSSTLTQEYVADVQETNAMAAAATPASTANSADYATAAKDPAVLAEGKATFDTTCAPCHGQFGQGVVGPNLTDDFWIHGATVQDVDHVIAKGVMEKGMPAWGEILGPTKVKQVIAYIISLQDSKPENPKPSQGQPGTLK